MKKQLILSCCGMASLMAGQAMAAVYNDLASFNGAINAGAYTNAFDDSGSGAFAVLSYTDGTFSYDVTASGAGCSGLFNDPGIVSTDSALDGILVTFTSGNVTAVGGNFWSSDISFAPITAEMTLTLSDGTIEVLTSGGPIDFRGFTSNSVITSIFIDADDSIQNAWSTLDNLIVGTMIPAPGSMALLGLGGIVAGRRRR